jgi:hypothetical protein
MYCPHEYCLQVSQLWTAQNSGMEDLPPEPFHLALQKGLQRKLGKGTKGPEALFSCIHSIFSDQLFVDELSTLYPTVPLFANIRCG